MILGSCVEPGRLRSVKTINMNKLEVRGSRWSSVSVTSDECFQGKGQWMRGDWSIPGNSALLLNRRLLEYWYMIVKPALSVSQDPNQITVKIPGVLICWKRLIKIKSFCRIITFTWFTWKCQLLVYKTFL